MSSASHRSRAAKVIPASARVSQSPSASSAAVTLRAHVIPNSHLDREWTLDYQQTRRLTVEFLDALLDILDRVPEYTFLLDSQTLPLEDYLEIRPENEERIRRAVQAGRMSIGPWYSAPDGNTISGESLVRNLLAGHRFARRFGKPMKAGYTPFGFGQVSQLPQIYAGFGIQTLFFYRGITSFESPEAEFLWESPDGTFALCSRFGSKARYNFFMEVWRPVAIGKPSGQRLYNWREGGLPFKRFGAEREFEHYFLLDAKKSIHREALESSFRQLIETERKHFTTNVIPLMQGMDTTRPDPLEAEIVREIREFLAPGEEIFFSTLEAYAEDLRKHLDLEKLKTFRGEMRNAGAPSPFITNLENIASARIRQKIAQHGAEKSLTRMAEPFAALAYAAGFLPYPKTYLDLAWKHLLQCHPHDTVAGCGIDKLERDSLYRLEQVATLADVVLDDALAAFQLHINNANVKDDEIILTLFNPSPRPRSEILDAYIDIPHDLSMTEFEIFDSAGKKVDQCFVYRRLCEKTVRDNADLTTALVGWTCKIQVRAESVPALGYKTLVMRRAAPHGRMERIAASPHCMENEFLRVEFQPSGTLNLLDKTTGREYRGLHYFVDGADTGQGWEARPAGEDQLISSLGAPVEIALVENTHLSASIRVRCAMQVPSGLIHNDSHHETKRGEKTVELPIESIFTLRAGARRLDIKTTIENKARNHRLRVFFPTDLTGAKTSAAETPFDVVERPIVRNEKHPYSQTANPVYPCLRFADISDGKCGLALLTQGIHEYEAMDDPARAIAATLLRAFETTLCTVSYRWERRPDQELSQVPGRVAARYALFPHAGNWEQGGVMREAEDFCLPLIGAQTGRGEGGVSGDGCMSGGGGEGGGRGKSGAHSEGGAPQDASLLEIQPETLVLSALKKAEDRDTLILRLYNPESRPAKGVIRFAKPIASVRLLDMNEDPLPPSLPSSLAGAPAFKLSRGVLRLSIPPKKVVTLEVAL